MVLNGPYVEVANTAASHSYIESFHDCNNVGGGKELQIEVDPYSTEGYYLYIYNTSGITESTLSHIISGAVTITRYNSGYIVHSSSHDIRLDVSNLQYQIPSIKYATFVKVTTCSKCTHKEFGISTNSNTILLK